MENLSWVKEMETVKILKEFLSNDDVDEIDEDVFETLLEDVVIGDQDWDEYRRLFHEDIPTVLMAMFREAGFSDCKIYDLRDGVTLPEYLANCVTEDGMKVAIELDVEYDPEAGEVELLLFRAYKDSYWLPSILVYYTDVTPKK